MDRELVLNCCVFAAICLISYSVQSNSFPNGQDSSNIFRKISQSAKMMDQQAVVLELLKSREKLEIALTLTRTRLEVRTNYGNHITTTSNPIPRGRNQPNENNHGSVVSPVVQDKISKRNHNQDLKYENYFHEHSDINDYSELGDGDSSHGTRVKAPSQTINDLLKLKSDHDLTVIPLSRQ